MNRVVSAIASGNAEDNASYEYDSCTGGAGRLCKLVRGVSELVYAYTAFGDIRSITQTIDTYPGFQQAISTLAYTYDTAGRQQDLTYPSGNKVTYTYDAAGNIYSVILNDGEANLITEARYLPFAGVTSEKRGNGTVVATSYDQAYRQQLRYGGGFYEYQVFDQLGNTLNQYVPGTASSFEYDALGRLEGAAGSFGTKEYGYDKNANRTSLVHDDVTSSNSYEANSNRMDMLAGESVILDANGNTISMRDMQMQYTHDNRLETITGKAVYEYNGLGQRIMKSVNARGNASSYQLIKTVFMYDQEGKLIAEIGPAGAVKREYVYKNNELLAVLDHEASGNETILQADVDADGRIGVEDFIVWWYNEYNPATSKADINGDGLVNQQDYNLVLNCALSGGEAAGCYTASYESSVYYAHLDHLGTPHMLTDDAGVACLLYTSDAADELR